MKIYKLLQENVNKISANDIYDLVHNIHHRLGDFDDGDISDRIYKYPYYVLKDVSLNNIELDEFDINDDMVEKYKLKIKNGEKMPFPVLNSDYSIIDGTHRLNALNELGVTHQLCYVGVRLNI